MSLILTVDSIWFGKLNVFLTRTQTSRFDSCVRRLEEVVSLFIVFEELSHVTNSFWSRHKVNPGIILFYERDFRSGRRSRSLLSSDTHGASSFYQTWEVETGFHLFGVWDFSLRSSNTLWLLYCSCDVELNVILYWFTCLFFFQPNILF